MFIKRAKNKRKLLWEFPLGGYSDFLSMSYLIIG